MVEIIDRTNNDVAEDLVEGQGRLAGEEARVLGIEGEIFEDGRICWMSSGWWL